MAGAFDSGFSSGFDITVASATPAWRLMVGAMGQWLLRVFSW